MAPTPPIRRLLKTKPHPKNASRRRAATRSYKNGFGLLSKSIFKKKPALEQPKIPFTRKLFWPRTLQILIHCIPIGITVYLVFISFRNVYWSDPSLPNTTTKLQAFQFAAKIYDVCICWSLATAVLYVLRLSLPKGVRLGSLVASYNFANASTFFSLPFWSGASRSATRSSLFLTAVLLVTALIAAISAPLAAILLIPKLQWWSVSHAKAFAQMYDTYGEDTSYQINAEQSLLWPAVLNASNLPSLNCNLSPEKQDEGCPGQGFQGLLNAATYYNTKLDDLGFALPSAYEPLNLSILETTTSHTPFIRPLTARLICFDYYSTGDVYGVVTSTPSLPLSSILWNALTGDTGTPISTYERPRIDIQEVNGHRPLKPFVQVKCNIQDESDLLEFPSRGLVTPPFMDSQVEGIINGICSTWSKLPNSYRGQNWTMRTNDIINASTLDSYIQQKSIHVSWVDLSTYSTRPSLAAAVFFPTCNSSQNSYQVAACTIDARWLSASMSIEPKSGMSIKGGSGSHFDFARSLAGNTTITPIYIGVDWAAALNSVVSTSSSLSSSETTAETILCKVFTTAEGSCDGWTDGVPKHVLEAELGFIIVDGLSRVGSESNYSIIEGTRGIYSRNGTFLDIVWSTENKPGTDWTNVTLAGFRNGYGWSLDTSTSMIAASVLLLHAFIAFIAICALLCKRELSDRWTTSGEILALALRSSPGEKGKRKLNNVGAGVDRIDTWKETVAIRVDELDYLQLIFLDEADERGMVEPEVDQRYR